MVRKTFPCRKSLKVNFSLQEKSSLQLFLAGKVPARKSLNNNFSCKQGGTGPGIPYQYPVSSSSRRPWKKKMDASRTGPQNTNLSTLEQMEWGIMQLKKGLETTRRVSDTTYLNIFLPYLVKIYSCGRLLAIHWFGDIGIKIRNVRGTSDRRTNENNYGKIGVMARKVI